MNPPVRIAVNLLLIAVGVHLTAGLGIHQLEKTLAGQRSAPITAPEKLRFDATQVPAASGADIISGRDLFQTAGPRRQPAPAPAAEIPEDAGRDPMLFLRGTVTGGNQEPMAVMGTGRNGPHRLVRIGDTIGGATIRQIQRERVVLVRNGRQSALTLDKP
jgi:hypothetical protein